MAIRACRVRKGRSLKRPNEVNAVLVRSLIRLSAVLWVAFALAGCGRSDGRSESYRYKLTLAVNTPNGVKRGSSIAEVTFFEVSISARGIMHKLRGEALYLDLGPGARPLIALIGRQTQPSSRQWRPTTQLSRLYDIPLSADVMDTLAQIARKRGRRTIAANELPDLVTFANVNDPDTVTEIDPNDLQATLGPGVNWSEITLEVTDEPITKGIEEKLPWIPYYSCFMLDGARYKDKNTLANSLSTADFYQSDDAIKKIKQKLLSSTDINAECWKSLRAWQQRPR